MTRSDSLYRFIRKRHPKYLTPLGLPSSFECDVIGSHLHAVFLHMLYACIISIRCAVVL